MNIDSRKRILFLDAYYEPEKTAYTHLERDLIDALVESGFDVTVICPQPTRGITKEIRRMCPFIELKHNGAVEIKRFRCVSERSNTVLRALRYCISFLKTLRLAKKDVNFDVIFCNSTPPIQGLLANKVKKYFFKKRKKNIPFIFNLQDIFPDSLVNLGLASAKSFAYKIGKIIEKKTYASADGIITISDSFFYNLKNKNVDCNKIWVVPNWIDNKEVRYISRQSNYLFDKYNLDRENFYFSYCGNIGYSQNFDMLLDAAKRIDLDNIKVGFVIVGDGAASIHLCERIAKEKINNVKLIPFQEYNHIAEVFSLGDVGLIISKKGVGCNSVPSKTWSYMAAQRPILCSFDKDSELCKLIESIDCGLVCDPNDINGFIGSIKQMYLDANLKEKGWNGMKYVVNHLDKSKCVKKYIEIINNYVQK